MKTKTSTGSSIGPHKNSVVAEKGILRADALLLLTAIIWGFAFSAQRSGMEHIGPFAYSGIRFAIGGLSMLPLLLIQRNRARAGTRTGGAKAGSGPGPATGLALGPATVTREKPAAPPAISPFTRSSRILWTCGAGLILFSGATLQQIGLVSTTAGNAGFITSLYVVLVPIVGTFLGKKSSPRIWTGAILALIGLYILSVQTGFVIAPGDLFVLVGAFFWAAHILVIARVATRMDPLRFALGQYIVVSVLSLILAIATESAPFAGTFQAAIPILYGGILSIGVAFTLQIIAQKTAHPAHASIILSMEALFAAIGGVLILREPLGIRLIAGGALMLTGMIISQTGETAS